MSYLPLDQMAFRDGPALDAFGRLRISDSVQLLGATQEYTFHPLTWDHFTATGGTATYSVSTSSTVLRTNAATSGARALRQTKVYYRYNPGKSHLIKLTGAIRKSGTPAGAAFSALGYYDDNNGVFFRSKSGGVYAVIRTNTSGSVAEVETVQSSWNLDKMDGTGSSGVTIDWTKEQIFIIDLQWLGVGRVRFGLFVDGSIIYVHEVLHENVATSVYMRTANLPVRYEVFNSGGAGSDISLEAICASVESEAGVLEDNFYPFAYSAYLTPMSLDTTLRPVVTRRLRDTFNGLTVRGHAALADFQMRVGTNDIYWEIRYNQTVTLGGGGSATVNDVDSTYSISEYATYAGAANTVSGGVLIANGFMATGSGSVRTVSQVSQSDSLLLLGRTYANVRDSFTLSARAATGTATISLAVGIKEQY
jgi:hypothetical protein